MYVSIAWLIDMHRTLSSSSGTGCRATAAHQLMNAFRCRAAALCMCRSEASRLSHTAQAMTHRAAAADSDSEAATFHLLAHLYGDADPRAASAGFGGSAPPDCGKATTVKQRMADIIATDPALNR